MKTLRFIPLILALAMLPLVLSCEFTATEDTNDIKIVVLCNGSSCIKEVATGVYGASFTVSYLLDNDLPISQGPTSKLIAFQYNDPEDKSLGGDCFSIYPAGDISKATITITRDSTANSASITLMIYNNDEADKNGYANLPTCTAGTSSTCSNTLNLQYEVKDDDTDGASSTSSSKDDDEED
jgi:hypothetical protein